MKRMIDSRLIRKVFNAEYGVIVDVGITDGYMERVFVTRVTTDVVVVFGEDSDMEWVPVMEFNTRKLKAVLFSDDRERQLDFKKALEDIEDLKGRFDVVMNPRTATLAESLGVDVKGRELSRI